MEGVLGRHQDQLTREIIEAKNIARQEERCVSTPSIMLSKRTRLLSLTLILRFSILLTNKGRSRRKKKRGNFSIWPQVHK